MHRAFQKHHFSPSTFPGLQYPDFLHLKKNTITTGSVYIHNSAFSPPGNFHFRVEINDVIYLVTSAFCPDLPNKNVVSLFIIMDDKFKIEKVMPYVKCILLDNLK